MSLNIYFIRHGQTHYNKIKRLQGHSNIDINETGKEQAKNAAKKLELLDIHNQIVIFTSDLERTIHTANIIEEHLNTINKFNIIDNIKDERLRELNFGKYEGVFQWDIPKEVVDRFDYLHNEYDNYDDFYEMVYYDGETIKDMIDRIKLFLYELYESYTDKTIIIVGHGLSIKTVKHIVTKKPMDRKLDNCSIHKFEMKSNSLDDMEYLGEL